jgi:hypothetical protein
MISNLVFYSLLLAVLLLACLIIHVWRTRLGDGNLRCIAQPLGASDPVAAHDLNRDKLNYSHPPRCLSKFSHNILDVATRYPHHVSSALIAI